jgi:hypothetical protein
MGDINSLPVTLKLGVGGFSKENHIAIAGEDITNFVRAIRIESSVGSLTRVFIELVKVEIDGQVESTPMTLGEWADKTNQERETWEAAEDVAEGAQA